jgi:hypothetical protein
MSKDIIAIVSAVKEKHVVLSVYKAEGLCCLAWIMDGFPKKGIAFELRKEEQDGLVSK